jgi:nitrogen-specific signal transduction histidine kinase
MTLLPMVTPLHAPDAEGRTPASPILAAIQDAAASIDGSGLVSGWNAAAAERFGLSAAEVLGRPLVDLHLAEPSDPRALARLPLSERAGGGTLLVWTAARDTLPPEALQLQKAQVLGRLAGPVSHDLAQPLGAILSLASYLGFDADVPEDLRGSAALLRGEADRTLRMVRSLLEIVRTRDADPRGVALEPIVRGILELESGLLINVATVVSIPDSLPEVHADPARLRQVVLTLTMNAIGALGSDQARGHLTVTAQVAAGVEPRAIRLVIEDSAPVVPEAERPSLFAAFPAVEVQARPFARDLAAAAHLVALDGGRLWHEPLEAGNRFVVEMLAESRAAERSAPAGDGSMSDPRGSDRPPVTVLVCDDEASIRVLIVRMLEREGIRAIEAASGEEALHLVADATVTAVMADHRMAEISGVELYTRAIAVRPDLAGRFLMMSGDAGDAELTEFAQATGLRILSKPFAIGALPAAMRTLAGL